MSDSAGSTGRQLRPISPLSEAHRALVGQQVDGWPVVQVLDGQGVVVHGEPVEFQASGAAVLDVPGGVLRVDSDRRGRAHGEGLLGQQPGQATVLVSVAGAEPLQYPVDVVQAG
jgi:hypothetical protein